MSKYGPPPLSNYEKYLKDGSVNYVDNEYLMEKIKGLNVYENTTEAEKADVVVRLIRYAKDAGLSDDIRYEAAKAVKRVSTQFEELQAKRQKELEAGVDNLGIF